VVHAHETVLASTRVALARRVDGNRVNGTEVPAHATDLLLEDLVPEPRLESALTRARSSNFLGILAAAKQDVRPHRCNGGTVERRLGRVRFEHMQSRSLVQLWYVSDACNGETTA